MKTLLTTLMIIIQSGCVTKYSYVQPDGSKMLLENYVVTESFTYNAEGKVLKSKRTMIPMYEGVIGKVNTLVKPILELLVME